jgi:hypothetical protein
MKLATNLIQFIIKYMGNISEYGTNSIPYSCGSSIEIQEYLRWSDLKTISKLRAMKYNLECKERGATCV